MNLFTFCGRLTGDPEIRYSTGAKQTAIASMTVAINRDYKREGEPDADFFKCVCFGKSAESVEKYLSKGVKIIGTGSMQNSNYEKDGVKHYGVQIMLNKWEFAESKKSAAEAGESEAAPTQTARPASDDGFMKVSPNFDIDMPFA